MSIQISYRLLKVKIKLKRQIFFPIVHISCNENGPYTYNPYDYSDLIDLLNMIKAVNYL